MDEEEFGCTVDLDVPSRKNISMLEKELKSSKINIGIYTFDTAGFVGLANFYEKYSDTVYYISLNLAIAFSCALLMYVHKWYTKRKELNVLNKNF